MRGHLFPTEIFPWIHTDLSLQQLARQIVQCLWSRRNWQPRFLSVTFIGAWLTGAFYIIYVFCLLLWSQWGEGPKTNFYGPLRLKEVNEVLAFSYRSLIFIIFAKLIFFSTCAHCFMLRPSCKASEGTFTSNRDSSLNSHSSFTVTATIIVNNVGKVITPFSLFSLFPSPPESMLDKTKFVFVRNYSYLSQHWIEGTRGLQEKSK